MGYLSAREGNGGYGAMCASTNVYLVEREGSTQLTKFRVHFTFQLCREDENKTKLL